MIECILKHSKFIGYLNLDNSLLFGVYFSTIPPLLQVFHSLTPELSLKPD